MIKTFVVKMTVMIPLQSSLESSESEDVLKLASLFCPEMMMMSEIKCQEETGDFNHDVKRMPWFTAKSRVSKWFVSGNCNWTAVWSVYKKCKIIKRNNKKAKHCKQLINRMLFVLFVPSSHEQREVFLFKVRCLYDLCDDFSKQRRSLSWDSFLLGWEYLNLFSLLVVSSKCSSGCYASHLERDLWLRKIFEDELDSSETTTTRLRETRVVISLTLITFWSQKCCCHTFVVVLVCSKEL